MTASSNMQVPIVVSASEAMVQQNAGVPPQISLWSSSPDYFCRNTSLQAMQTCYRLCAPADRFLPTRGMVRRQRHES